MVKITGVNTKKALSFMVRAFSYLVKEKMPRKGAHVKVYVH